MTPEQRREQAENGVVMEEKTDVPKITIDPVVKLWQCKGNADCLHDEGQWKSCYACNPPQPVEESQAPPVLTESWIRHAEELSSGMAVHGAAAEWLTHKFIPAACKQLRLSLAADGLAEALRKIKGEAFGRAHSIAMSLEICGELASHALAAFEKAKESR